MPKRFLYYDTETTGTQPDKDRIIEIAAYDPEQGRTFQQFVNPGIPIPPEASAIHNINDEMVASAPSFSLVGEQFRAFCEGEVVLVAHNNDRFDRLFLEEEYKREGLPFPPFCMIDSLKWARKYRPDLPRHSLQFLRQMYGIPENRAHRALEDVFILHQVFTAMIDDLDAETVLKLLDEKEEERMPFGKYQGKPLREIPPSYFSWLRKEGCFDKVENRTLKNSLEKLGLLT